MPLAAIWRHASFDQLADDLLAAVRHIAARDDIDERRIGVWGTSQGGWIGPLAASKGNDVALLVPQVPPAVTPEFASLIDEAVQHEWFSYCGAARQADSWSWDFWGPHQ